MAITEENHNQFADYLNNKKTKKDKTTAKTLLKTGLKKMGKKYGK
jgi:hypothetical protein